MEHVLLEPEVTANGICGRARLKSRSESEDRDMERTASSSKASDVAEGRPELVAPVVHQMSLVNTEKAEVLAEQLRVRNVFPLLLHQVFRVNTDQWPFAFSNFFAQVASALASLGE
jgi:hypothetical protein